MCLKCKNVIHLFFFLSVLRLLFVSSLLFHLFDYQSFGFLFSIQGHKEWLAEVQFLGVVSHPNLVKLIGYCSVDGERGIQRLLVYEFMPNKSLEHHLFNRALPGLPWLTRLKVMLDAAEGLAYLHEGLEVKVHYIFLLLS